MAADALVGEEHRAAGAVHLPGDHRHQRGGGHQQQALAELQLDIRRAKIQTFGAQAVDSFYLCDALGHKLSDPEVLTELELAIRSAVGQEVA